MAFPSSPSNNDVHIKDGLRYVYASATNAWTIQSDPNKNSENIKDTVEIDGVTGNYDHEATNPITAGNVILNKVGFVNGNKITGTINLDGNAGVGDVVSGKTFFNTTTGKQTGTLVTPTFSGPISYVGNGANAPTITYYKYGKIYFFGYASKSGNLGKFLNTDDTANELAAEIGITIASRVQTDLIPAVSPRWKWMGTIWGYETSTSTYFLDYIIAN